MTAQAYIYALCDPDSNAVRYVGQTARPEARLRQHVADQRPMMKVTWIQGLIAVGKRPVMTILETCAPADRFTAERRHIEAQLRAGADLLNGVFDPDRAPYTPQRRPPRLVDNSAEIRAQIAKVQREINVLEGQKQELERQLEIMRRESDETIRAMDDYIADLLNSIRSRSYEAELRSYERAG